MKTQINLLKAMQLETRKKVVPLYMSKEQATNKSANKH
jgi:hypothetical protein